MILKISALSVFVVMAVAAGRGDGFGRDQLSSDRFDFREGDRSGRYDDRDRQPDRYQPERGRGRDNYRTRDDDFPTGRTDPRGYDRSTNGRSRWNEDEDVGQGLNNGRGIGQGLRDDYERRRDYGNGFGQGSGRSRRHIRHHHHHEQEHHHELEPSQIGADPFEKIISRVARQSVGQGVGHGPADEIGQDARSVSNGGIGQNVRENDGQIRQNVRENDGAIGQNGARFDDGLGIGQGARGPSLGQAVQVGPDTPRVRDDGYGHRHHQGFGNGEEHRHSKRFRRDHHSHSSYHVKNVRLFDERNRDRHHLNVVL